MRYASVCSGIEAATQAWRALGWRAVFYSEIDQFPQAVLRHHYGSNILGGSIKRKSQTRRPGGVWNFGDFTSIRLKTLRRLGIDTTIDLLVGGTPCQSFSIAGLRGGLDDSRGNLALEFIRLAFRLSVPWVLWENVPGVLSSGGGEDFRCLLSGFAGYEVKIPKGGWKNSGIITPGPNGYGLAWRVLDAQYFGVPQRRRRVFLVGYFGDWRYPAAVLFERESLRRDSPPSRKAGAGIATEVAACLNSGGNDGGFRTEPGEHLVPDTAYALNAKGGSGRIDGESETFVAEVSPPVMAGAPFSRTGNERVEIEAFVAERAPALSASNHYGDHESREGLLVAEVAGTLNHNGKAAGSATNQDAENGLLVAHTLKGEGFDASEDGTGRGIGAENDPSFTFQSAHHHAVGVSIRGRAGGATAEISGEVSMSLRASQGGGDKAHVLSDMAVRRMMPRECERLQGVKDDFTLVPYRGKAAADGPRYKALGNSMAVPVMRWIGERIDMVNKIILEENA